MAYQYVVISLLIFKNKSLLDLQFLLYLLLYFALFIAKLLKTAVVTSITSSLPVLSLTFISQALFSLVILKLGFSSHNNFHIAKYTG